MQLNSAKQFLEDIRGQRFADQNVCRQNTYIVRCVHTEALSHETGEGKKFEHAS